MPCWPAFWPTPSWHPRRSGTSPPGPAAQPAQRPVSWPRCPAPSCRGAAILRWARTPCIAVTALSLGTGTAAAEGGEVGRQRPGEEWAKRDALPGHLPAVGPDVPGILWPSTSAAWRAGSSAPGDRCSLLQQLWRPLSAHAEPFCRAGRPFLPPSVPAPALGLPGRVLKPEVGQRLAFGGPWSCFSPLQIGTMLGRR